MPSPVNRAKKFAAMSLLVLGYGAYNGLRAEIQPCTSFNEGRCDQFCIDRGADAEWVFEFWGRVQLYVHERLVRQFLISGAEGELRPL